MPPKKSSSFSVPLALSSTKKVGTVVAPRTKELITSRSKELVLNYPRLLTSLHKELSRVGMTTLRVRSMKFAPASKAKGSGTTATPTSKKLANGGIQIYTVDKARAKVGGATSKYARVLTNANKLLVHAGVTDRRISAMRLDVVPPTALSTTNCPPGTTPCYEYIELADGTIVCRMVCK